MTKREVYFATDLMRFIAKKYSLGWAPLEQQHATSPFTAHIEVGVEVYLRYHDDAILQKYEEKFGDCTPNMQMFKKFLGEGFSQIGVTAGKEKEIFQGCAAAARFALLFYYSGITDAPDVAIEVVERVLREFNQRFDIDIFQHFNKFCLKLAAYP